MKVSEQVLQNSNQLLQVIIGSYYKSSSEEVEGYNKLKFFSSDSNYLQSFSKYCPTVEKNGVKFVSFSLIWSK